MHLFSYLFVAFVALSLGVQLWLAQRHARHVQQHSQQVPATFSAQIDLAAHQKAAHYTVTKTRFGQWEMILGYALLLIWTFGGGLEYLDSQILGLGLTPIWSGVVFILAITLISSLLELPVSGYRTFRIEQRFGFNNTTFKLFISDNLKQLLLSLLIGLPLIWLVLWLMTHAGGLWWLYVWAVWMGFSLLMMWIYPAFIAPLFNKFTELADTALRSRIEQLLSRCGFSSNGIFVMDGSRRSSHGNAYFTGLGSNKRIVFFDTLLNSLTHDETEAVLAHELGHFKRKHILKHLGLMAALSLGGLALLGWLMQQSWFYSGLGVSTPSLHMALVLFMLIMPVFTFFFSPLMSLLMRKHEFEADEYAARQSDPQHLISALVKLYKDNASTLTPDPLYSGFYDSHPPAPVRIVHLQQLQHPPVSD